MSKILEINLYKYNELSKEAQEKAYKDWRRSQENWFYYPWQREAEQSFEAFAELIGSEIRNMNFCSIEEPGGFIYFTDFMHYSSEKIIEMGEKAFEIGENWSITGCFTDAIFQIFANKIRDNQVNKNTTPEQLKNILIYSVREYGEYIEKDMYYLLSKEVFEESDDAIICWYLKDGRAVSQDLLNITNYFSNNE